MAEYQAKCFCGAVEITATGEPFANYQEAVLRVRDGLPKLRDFPKEMGARGKPCPSSRAQPNGGLHGSANIR